MLLGQAARYGERPLARVGTLRLTFAGAPVLAARAAGMLAAAGVRRGDRVALMMTNRPEFIEIWLGCGWLGAVAVPINVSSRGLQLAHILDNSGARLLAVEADLLLVLQALPPQNPRPEIVWTVGERPPAGGGPAALPKPPLGEAIAPSAIGPGQDLAILYTSGTTGPSKGVRCPHAQFYWWGTHTAALLELVEGDVLSTTLPLYHTNAMNTFFQALLVGGTASYAERFSASRFWDGLVADGATATYVLGAMLPMLLSRPPSSAERAHNVRVALAPGVPARFHGPWRERTGISLVDGYGSTETNFVIGAAAGRQRPGFMGPVVPGFEARVVDEDDNAVPDGIPGELVLRASEPYAFANGYHDMPEKTVEAWRNLWFHSGDRVVREPDGEFRFIDRLKDAIRRRGENISSFEVEQVLLSHPAVAACAVFPVRSELAEDEVMAAVVVREGARLDPLDLVRFCEPLLAHFAVPRFIDIVPALPLTENGKVQKFKLRERGVGPGTFDREASGYMLRRR
jgi:crotonobetaine/carnitine-CoA ligase